MLAYENRIVENDRACDELFFLINNELIDITYLQALIILLNVTFAQTTADGMLNNEQISCLISILSLLSHISSGILVSFDVVKLSRQYIK